MLTVEQLYKVFTDSCDLITMQKHTGDLTFGNNFSIATLPIEGFGDSFIHQGFDLTHDQKSDGVCFGIVQEREGVCQPTPWGSTPLHLANVGAVRILKLGGPDGGRMTQGVGDGVELAAIVAVGNPDGLAIAEAGGRRESHWFGW